MIFNDVNMLMRWQTNPYTEVNYIEGETGGYIDTLYVPNASSVIENYYTYTLTANWQRIIGAYSDNNNRLVLQRYSSTGSVSVYLNATQNFVNVGSGTPLKAVFDLPNMKFISNGGTASLNGTIATTVPWYLHTIGTSGSKGRIYGCTIKENDVTIKNFVPAIRNSDSVVGMLEKVNNVFYTNAGTGTFTYG